MRIVHFELGGMPEIAENDRSAPRRLSRRIELVRWAFGTRPVGARHPRHPDALHSPHKPRANSPPRRKPEPAG
jgi:hypothetical protein